MQKPVYLAISFLYVFERDPSTKNEVPIIKYICAELWLNFFKNNIYYDVLFETRLVPFSQKDMSSLYARMLLSLV